MQMRIILAVVLLLCIAPSTQALDVPQCPSSKTCDRNPEHLQRFVSTFYTWYIVSTFENKMTWEDEPIHSVLKETLTPDLLRRLPVIAQDMGPDGLIYAQDYNDTWFYPIVKIQKMNKDSAEMTVGLPGSYIPFTLSVSLRIAGGKWRIDDVRERNP